MISLNLAVIFYKKHNYILGKAALRRPPALTSRSPRANKLLLLFCFCNFRKHFCVIIRLHSLIRVRVTYAPNHKEILVSFRLVHKSEPHTFCTLSTVGRTIISGERERAREIQEKMDLFFGACISSGCLNLS